MTKFVVNTHDDRNFVIEANSFAPASATYTYNFRAEDGKLLASVNINGTLAVIAEESLKGDFYSHDDLSDPQPDSAEPENDDTNFEQFYNLVWDIIDDWHAQYVEDHQPDEPNGAEVTE